MTALLCSPAIRTMICLIQESLKLVSLVSLRSSPCSVESSSPVSLLWLRLSQYIGPSMIFKLWKVFLYNCDQYAWPQDYRKFQVCSSTIISFQISSVTFQFSNPHSMLSRTNLGQIHFELLSFRALYHVYVAEIFHGMLWSDNSTYFETH